MLEIVKNIGEEKAEVVLKGRLDTVSAPELEKEIGDVLPLAGELTLNLEELEYISSAGLRIVLAMQKAMMAKEGKMTLTNVNSTIMDIFEITGFSDILTIE